MKKGIGYFYLLLCSIFLASCGNSIGQPVDSQTQTIYIGDNTKVSQIAASLPYPSGLAYDSIEIQSEKVPYELKVFVFGVTEDNEELEKCADEAFDKISNMGVISFYQSDSGELLATYSQP